MKGSDLFIRLRRKGREINTALKISCRNQGLLPAHKNYTRFVIITSIRSGSTMLGDYLNSHPQVMTFFELFHRYMNNVPFGLRGYDHKSRDPKVVQLRNTDPVKFLEDHILTKHSPDTKAVGFKLLYTQARTSDPWWNGPDFERWWKEVGRAPLLPNDKSDLWSYLKESRDIKIIHLVRRNYLEKTLSAHKAIHSGQWGIGATGGFQQDVPLKVRLNYEELSQDFEAFRRMEEETDEFFREHSLLKLSYEDLIGNPEDTFESLFNFLGVPSINPSTNTQKQNQQCLRESIENYGELKEKFQQTAYNFMFN